MNYRDFGITREQRDILQYDIACLRPYIMCVKKQELGIIRCEDCGRSGLPLEIHHTSYDMKLTYYDLKLLCKYCHNKLRDNSTDDHFDEDIAL